MPVPIHALEAAHEVLRGLIASSSCGVGFTGAGISTECGVPDFRSPDSPWTRHFPIDFEAFRSSPAIRAEAWRRKFAIDDLCAGARPGCGHRALAALVGSGKLIGVITQNIDGLHQASGLGSEHVIELHGNGTYAACLGCGARHELVDIRASFEATGVAPDCACGAPVKSATISFGQAMPQGQMRRAREATLACDLFLAIGSSLVVYPAAGFPTLAKDNGATLVIINREATPLDGPADVVIRGEIGDVLAPFAESTVAA
ncbi:MAG: Sir2 family NAD-dependent protein deacetylase [Methylobacteriaceae bacterium]|nr:Sir2 family NAD-dependent protein deacetylase [Methylobacteriaceae bacterium]